MRRLAPFSLAGLLLPHLALAQVAAPDATIPPPAGQPVPAVSPETVTPTTTLPQVNIVTSTPLLGPGVNRDKIPYQTNVITDEDISRNGNADALRALNENVPGLTLGAAAGNPFQPNLLYHGFQASPLQGNSQGLAVYVNGARFNQAFGDTVNWDLLPDIAISRISVEGSNPVFGLNALGGALSVQMKNGFTYHGGEFDVLGGSFEQGQAEFQYGRQSGDVATYVAGSGQHQDGWRDLQSSDLYNFFGDVGWRGDSAEAHLSITAADTVLNGPGTAPVELLDVSPSGQFTAPNQIANKYVLVNLNGSVDVSDVTSLQGTAYYDYFQQRVSNGNVSDATSCDDGSNFLCVAPGVYATGRDGNPIPDFLNGGPYSELDQQTTNTNGYGVSGQVTNTGKVLGHTNRLVAGLSFDGADTEFSANSAVGGLTTWDRVFVGPGIVIDQADGSIAPVRVGVTNAYYGAFFNDIFDIAPRLSLTAGGRFNAEEINLQDQDGTALTGNHYYSRFNPASGVTYKALSWLTVYAGYAEANRAPTPAELSCASAASPCSLANFFVGDPDLKQVVAHTIEAGLRGRFHPFEEATLDWNAGYFHSDLDDDILFVNSPIAGRAFFQNVGTTRRQGVDVSATLSARRWHVLVAYSYIDATFQTRFTSSSENNPGADANGNIQVSPGDHIPGIPANLVKLGVTYDATEKWTIGATGVGATGQYLVGDEANLQAKTPGYFIVNINTSYQVTPNVQLFGVVQNLLDSKYYTYGTFSPTSSIFIAQAPGATNPRSYSPGAPVGGYAGVRVTF